MITLLSVWPGDYDPYDPPSSVVSIDIFIYLSTINVACRAVDSFLSLPRFVCFFLFLVFLFKNHVKNHNSFNKSAHEIQEL